MAVTRIESQPLSLLTNTKPSNQISDIAPLSSNLFLDIHGTTECTFTLSANVAWKKQTVRDRFEYMETYCWHQKVYQKHNLENVFHFSKPIYLYI